MIIRKIKNKKAQVGLTIQWFVAFIVIFFIMLLFGIMATVAGGRKGFDIHIGDNSQSFKSYQQGIALDNVLIALDEKVDNDKKLKEILLSGLDVFLSDEQLMQCKDMEYDINKLGVYVDIISKPESKQGINVPGEISIPIKANLIQINNIRDELKKIFDKFCNGYILETPYGTISTTVNSGLTESISVFVPYKYEDDNYIFVHGGLVPECALKDQEKYLDTLIWARDSFIRSDYDWGKKVIFGHTADYDGRYNPPTYKTFEPIVMWNKIGIDTAICPPSSKKLTAIELPTEKMYFQEALYDSSF